jgi:hypothetical protein
MTELILLWFAWHVVAPIFFILAVATLVLIVWLIRRMRRMLK